jgi:hypothetical protein
MKKITIIIAAIFTGVLVGCENEVEPGQNSLVKMSNEWWGQIYGFDANGDLEDMGYGYQHFLTSNTASGSSDSLFVDDFGDFFELKAKVACNANDLSFTTNGTAVLERYSDGTVIIENGKVIIDGGQSTTGVKVDSIYFEAEFDWDPGTKYIVAGHARTGFAADEH